MRFLPLYISALPIVMGLSLPPHGIAPASKYKGDNVGDHINAGSLGLTKRGKPNSSAPDGQHVAQPETGSPAANANPVTPVTLDPAAPAIQSIASLPSGPPARQNTKVVPAKDVPFSLLEPGTTIEDLVKPGSTNPTFWDELRDIQEMYPVDESEEDISDVDRKRKNGEGSGRAAKLQKIAPEPQLTGPLDKKHAPAGSRTRKPINDPTHHKSCYDDNVGDRCGRCACRHRSQDQDENSSTGKNDQVEWTLNNCGSSPYYDDLKKRNKSLEDLINRSALFECASAEIGGCLCDGIQPSNLIPDGYLAAAKITKPIYEYAEYEYKGTGFNIPRDALDFVPRDRRQSILRLRQSSGGNPQ